MPSRLCMEPRCPDLAVYRGRCAGHARLTERTRTKRGRTVYNTKRWRLLRRKKLRLDPLCERCGDIGVDVHHRHGVTEVTWAIEALETLCKRCHGQATRQEQLSA